MKVILMKYLARVWKTILILSCRRSLWYRNLSIDLQSKSMDWSLHGSDLRHESLHEKCPNTELFLEITPYLDTFHAVKELKLHYCSLFSHAHKNKNMHDMICAICLILFVIAFTAISLDSLQLSECAIENS